METGRATHLSDNQILNYSPYSLGKLIEWKLEEYRDYKAVTLSDAPYSLGKLIEWKLG